MGPAMAFDSNRGRTVLFGGHETWEWDGQDWTQIQDVGPPNRGWTVMAFDSARGRTVLFGGAGKNEYLRDTWEWDGQDWTQVQDVGPSARSGQALSFDSDAKVTLLFGGVAPTGLDVTFAGATATMGDTWAWDGTAWTQLDDTGPPARDCHAMAYAADRKRTVLFGGEDTNLVTLSDTWEWDTKHWTHVQDVGPARVASAMAFSGAGTFLFGGGQNELATAFGDTWEWDGQHWVERQDMGPPARWLHAMAYDSHRGRLVLFGGTANYEWTSVLGDTWEAPPPPGA
jgi:hypothetical protein